MASCRAEASASAWTGSPPHARAAQLLTKNRRGILTFLAEEFLEQGETCWALSVALKLSRLNEVDLCLVEDFMGKGRCGNRLGNAKGSRGAG